MGRDEDELELNTLHRFAKHSPRMVLEEYSHCEVPAGCGGAILRWRDPSEGVPLQVTVACGGELDIWVDGQLVRGSFALPPGPHHIALQLTAATIPAIAATIRRAGPGLSMRDDPAFWTTSAQTRIHRMFERGWEQPDFDDAHWGHPRSAEVDLGNREWRFQQVERQGARTIPTLGPELWLRDRFVVPG